MPKGLHFTTVVFSFFLSFFLLFSTPNLCSHWTDLNKTWDTFTSWLLFEKFGANSPGHLPPWAGGEKTVFGTDSELWPNISLQWNMISIIGKKFVNLHGIPYMPPPNGWERLASCCPLPKFSHWETLPTLIAWAHGRYITESRQTLARVVLWHELTVFWILGGLTLGFAMHLVI